MLFFLVSLLLPVHDEHSQHEHAHEDVAHEDHGTDAHLHDHDNESWWSLYLELMSDPAHVLAELTFVVFHLLVLDLLLFRYVRKAWQKRLDRRFAEEHAILDQEHGHVHK